ncbi:hypothetical protein ACS0TY_011605 [Phlomoides rotata]
MDSLTCKKCGEISSVTPSTHQIRCHGCETLFSTGSPSNEVWTTGENPIVESRGFETRCSLSRRSKDWSQELQKKKTEAKNFFKGKCSSSKHPQNQPWTQSPNLVTSDLPPRGKRALICGVSYKKQKCELKGSAQDVRSIRDLLVEVYDFPTASIRILAEEEPYFPPTRKNIEDHFKWLVRNIQPGDSLVFYFSGHGKRQRDHIGDEIDGFDETICPMDFERNGMILDNDINDAIVKPLTQDVTLHAIVDSCHSGTVLDLPRVFNNTRGKWEDNSPPSGAYKGTKGGKAICFSACEDYQLAADTSAFSVEMTGAMTITFIQATRAAFEKNKNITYQDIMNYMHHTLKQAHKSGRLSGIFRIFHRRILQDPQLSASVEFDTNTEFNL